MRGPDTPIVREGGPTPSEPEAEPSAPALVVGVSWGNDSVALVQFLHEEGLEGVVCLYNDTGWSMPAHGNYEGWADRVTRMEAWAQSLGFKTARTASIGMEALVHDRKAWPRQGMQFCTDELKIGPTLKWLCEEDPEREAIMVNGKRRAEGHIRAQTPEWIEESPIWDRRVWQPLYDHDNEARDALILRGGHEVLPFKSKECMLCVNTNRDGLVAAPEVAIAWVARVEGDVPPSPTTGKPKTMFRPARKMGATGIREVVEWAKAPPRKYRRAKDLMDDGTGPSGTDIGCAGGLCE